MAYIPVRVGDLIKNAYGDLLIVIATYEDEGRYKLLGENWVMTQMVTDSNYRIQLNLSSIKKVYKGCNWK